MKTNVDLNEVENFIKDSKFVDFMNKNALSFGAMAFILQTLFDKINEIEAAQKA